MILKSAALAAAMGSLLATSGMVPSAHALTPDEILERNELSLVRISVAGIQRDGKTALPPRNGIGFFISNSGATS
jgi:hypothetical protein